MSASSSTVDLAIGVLGGAAVGAFLTGLVSIHLQQKALVQSRRAEVYVDALSWIGARVPQLAKQAKQEAPPAPLPAAREVVIPQGKITFPDPESTNLDLAATNPETRFYVALRARIVTFGSHDMARAFDRWVTAYLTATNTTKSCPGCICSLVGDTTVKGPTAKEHNHEVPKDSWFRTAWHWICRRRDPGIPKNVQGGLTSAVERCASSELRKG